jgi:quercetin dioxygenase-like cupin family protein
VTARRWIAPEAGERVGFDMVRKVLSGETHGRLCIAEATIPPGAFVPPHTHSREDEVTRVLSGELHVVIGDELVIATPGSYVLKPRHVSHAFWNAGPEPAQVIELVTPGTMDGYFEELHALALRRDGAAIDEHHLRYGVLFDPERAAELVTRYGIGARSPAHFVR